MARAKKKPLAEAPVAPVAAVDDAALARDSIALTRSGMSMDYSIDKLYRKGNVRTPPTLRIPEMILGIKRHGFKPNHPLVVSQKRDGSALVLCGNRRLEAIEVIHKNEPDVYAALFPSGTVPCVVHVDLTEEQESLLRVDHGKSEDRVPLDKLGQFYEIRMLVRSGYGTQSGIAEKMDWFKLNKKSGKMEPNRSFVQPYVNLAQLPVFVQEEYCRYMEDPTKSNVRWSGIAGLYAVHRDEYRTYPNGEGPLFQAAWAEQLNPVTETSVAKARPMTPADTITRSKLVGSRNLRAALRVFAGIGGETTLSDVDGAIIMAEAAEAQLAEIAEYLGESDFAELCRAAREALESKPEETALVA